MFWQLNLSVSRTGEKRAVSLWAGAVAALVWPHRRAGFGVTWGGGALGEALRGAWVAFHNTECPEGVRPDGLGWVWV